jgi:hypothetical protein
MYNDPVLFTLWAEKVEPTLYKLSKKGLNMDAIDNEIFTWWKTVGSKQKKSKHGEIIEALNFISYKRLDKSTKFLSSLMEIKCEEMHSKNAEAQMAEAKIQDLQTQLDKLLAEQLALTEKCKNHKYTIADLKANLNAEKSKSPNTLNSDGTKNVHFLDEAACSNNHASFQTDEAFDKILKRVPISAFKVIRHPNGTESSIRRPLTVTECNSFKAEIGPFPLKGPFEPWWRRIVSLKHAFQLEPKDIWQIVISSIPDVLIYKTPQVLMTGTIVQPMYHNEPESEIFNRLKQCLRDLRGCSPIGWELIFNRKQSSEESFETYAENMFELFEEYSGIKDVNHNHVTLLELLLTNAGPRVQQSLTYGASPAQNTFEGIVSWATRLESRKQMHCEVAVLECHENPPFSGEFRKPHCGKQNTLCTSCHKTGHTEEKCWSVGKGRPPPYFIKRRQHSNDTNQRSASNQSSNASKTLTELTTLVTQGLQLLASFASRVAAQ